MSHTRFVDRDIAVLLGGTAAEREVSLQSGATVIAALTAAGARVRHIDPADADWMTRLTGVEFVFNLLHGPGGEDGTMQGLLELLGVPYSGSGVLGSALAMDKVRTKRCWMGAGLPTPDFVLAAPELDPEATIARLGPVFVKPGCEGSSIGMSRAETPAQLESSIAMARGYTGEVLVESWVDGDEYTVAILGDRALPAIRIETDAAFYDYDAKYVSEDTRFFCPAGLDASDEAELARLALAAFRTIGGAVWGRVDVLRDRRGNWQLLEANTIPGMTSHSLVPMAARAAGLALIDLLAAMLEHSLEVRRHGRG